MITYDPSRVKRKYTVTVERRPKTEFGKQLSGAIQGANKNS